MKSRLLKLVAASLFLAGVSAKAVPITVDTVLADVAGQTASVDMTLSGSILTITIVNTTGAVGPSGAGGLLTGIAFTMPGNVVIVTSGSGVAVAAGSTIQGGSLSGSGGGTQLLGEWGYANGPGSGHFNGLAVDTQVSTMVADTDTQFGASIDNPDGLGGPEYGVMRTGGDRGGQTAINNSIVITLQLSSAPNGNFLQGIEGGLVAVTFGSPTGGTSVPDGGATVMLLGGGLLALGVGRRFLKS